MSPALKLSLSFIGKVFFPSYCLSCGKETAGMPTNRAWLCTACTHTLAPFPHTICPSCGVRTLEGRLNDTCRDTTHLTKFFCPYPLEQKAVRALVYTYKYRRAATLAPTITVLLYEWLIKQKGSLGSDSASFVIIPVPLHAKRFRERGFNQTELIAKHLGEKLGVSVCTDAIARVKPTSSQLEARNKEARTKNMRDAFRVTRAEQIAGKKVLLLDDVYTTGATMQSCANTLRASDAREIWGIAFARG